MASESCGDAALFKLWRVTKVRIRHFCHVLKRLAENTLLFYHEGLFWRCWRAGQHTGFFDQAFWCVIFALGVILVLIGGFVTICATPGTRHRLYETGGALFITGVLLFAVWVQVSDSLERYGFQRRRLVCPSLQLSVHYGPSFMLAPTAAFLCLLTGLLLLLIPSVSRESARDTENQPFSLREECV
uniref:Transmembrane protein 182 n=1 Tax=Sinocyclocheilus anshuiensis TaxID=1608454 RepID=A0A671MJR8_9TELE